MWIGTQSGQKFLADVERWSWRLDCLFLRLIWVALFITQIEISQKPRSDGVPITVGDENQNGSESLQESNINLCGYDEIHHSTPLII